MEIELERDEGRDRRGLGRCVRTKVSGGGLMP